jgi:hypothetical protein
LVDEPVSKSGSSAAPRPVAQRIGEALIFAGVILLSSVAVMAVAFAAPLVLIVSAIGGFFARKSDAGGWRPAGA